MEALGLSEDIIHAIIHSTRAGLEMAGVEPAPVSVSRYLVHPQQVSIVVGLVGDNTGNVTLNLSSRASVFLASGLLGEQFKELDEDVLDAVGEVCNILAGSLITDLEAAGHVFTTLSIPSTVVGANYSLFHFRGAHAVNVGFELKQLPLTMAHDRLFNVMFAFLES